MTNNKTIGMAMRRIVGGLTIFIWIWAGPGICRAQSQSLTTITGDTIQASVSTITNEKITGDQIPSGLEVSDVAVIQTGRSVSPGKGQRLVHLAGGGSLIVDRIEFSGESFSVSTPLLGKLQLPSDSVSGIVLQALTDPTSFAEGLSDRSSEQDRVIAQTSAGQQSVFGLLESIDDTKLRLNHQGQSRPVSISKVVAVVMADLQPTAPSGTHCQFHLTDSSTLVGSIEQMAEGNIKVNITGNHSLEFAWDAVASITVRSDRVAYLSDLNPVEAVHSPLATSEFHWQRDKSVAGNPISFLVPGGTTETFVKGIGTHSASRLEFVNDGFDRLAATVGMDAETLGRGDCIASIWADGIELWSARITGRLPPQQVDVDIQGMQRITLVVQAGNHLDLGDHVDWANVRFLKTRQ